MARRRRKRASRRYVVTSKRGRVIRGEAVVDLDKDGLPDRITFYRRKAGSGYAANVYLARRKKSARKKKKAK